MKGLYPLWKQDTKEVMNRFFESGFKSIVVCIDLNCLEVSFLGRELDYQFVKGLPDDVDVCGENGEFHTFVYDGPIFSSPIPFKIGETVFRAFSKDQQSKPNHDTGFGYLDLIDY